MLKDFRKVIREDRVQTHIRDDHFLVFGIEDHAAPEDLLERRAVIFDGLLGHSAKAGHQCSRAVAWDLDQTS